MHLKEVLLNVNNPKIDWSYFRVNKELYSEDVMPNKLIKEMGYYELNMQIFVDIFYLE